MASVGQLFFSGLSIWLLVSVPSLAYLLVAGRAKDVPRVGVRLLPVGAFYGVYVALIHWTQSPSVVARALHNGEGVIHLEKAVWLDWEPFLSHLAFPGATEYYDWAQLFVVVGVLSWCAVSCDAGQWRLAASSLAFIAGGGLVLYWLVPVAPPWLLPASYGVHAGGLMNLQGIGELMGAFPSLHTAWAGWVAMVVWAQAGGRWWQWLGWLNLVLTAVVVLVTGNHYVVDVVAGELLAFGGCEVADFLERARRRPVLPADPEGDEPAHEASGGDVVIWSAVLVRVVLLALLVWPVCRLLGV